MIQSGRSKGIPRPGRPNADGPEGSVARVCREETGDEVVLMKDRLGQVIGVEKLNFSVPGSDSLRVVLDTAP